MSVYTALKKLYQTEFENVNIISCNLMRKTHTKKISLTVEKKVHKTNSIPKEIPVTSTLQEALNDFRIWR